VRSNLGTRSNLRHRPGFTLVELLVVIFLIGVLLAATLTIVPKVKRAVYQASTQAELSAIAGAIQQYYNDFRAYPGPLPNNQLGTAYDSSTAPYIGSASSPNYLVGTLGGGSLANTPTASALGMDTTHITGAENLVLGLCGGLLVNANNSNAFEYHPEFIFGPDGSSPAPVGPASLNNNTPRKQQAYISLKPGYLSVPNNQINKGCFTDSANRGAQDSMIPEFVDQFSESMPILYYRTTVGATAIVGFRNASSLGGSQLTDPTTSNPVTAQYDLLSNYGYTSSQIDVKPNTYHGLQGIGNANNLSDSIDANQGGVYLPSNNGSNGVAYFKDPSLNQPYNANTSPEPCNTYQGVARQKDGYVLISAGPDRLYGTHDDNIYPGPLQP
jgi:prepilin-type N-terminal cleavage/methylation domain-containing protein